MAREWKHRLTDIIEAIELIYKYIEGYSFEQFQKDRKTIDAVTHKLVVIGEAAKNLPDKIKILYPSIPWLLMADMRNFMVHEYWDVHLIRVWDTIQKDLPLITPQLEQILKENL